MINGKVSYKTKWKNRRAEFIYEIATYALVIISTMALIVSASGDVSKEDFFVDVDGNVFYILCSDGVYEDSNTERCIFIDKDGNEYIQD